MDHKQRETVGQALAEWAQACRPTTAYAEVSPQLNCGAVMTPVTVVTLLWLYAIVTPMVMLTAGN